MKTKINTNFDPFVVVGFLMLAIMALIRIIAG